LLRVPSGTRRWGSGAPWGGVGATTAWLIGGPLVDGPGWRWIFFIDVPAGLAAADALTVLLGAVAVGVPFVLMLNAQRVLGYSALKSGVSSVVLAAGVPAGAIAGRGAVLRAGFRPAAATGLALMAAGSLVLTQVPVPGSYFPDIFTGLLLCGPGIGLAFVTATVAALAGIAGHESGLASGLSNTALQTGTALGTK
jgi:hypothetical protein